MVTGVPGTFVDTQRTAGGMSVFSAPRDQGGQQVRRDVGLERRPDQHGGRAPLLPNIDGIWAQGGTDGDPQGLSGRRPAPPADRRRIRKRVQGVHERGRRARRPSRGYSIGQPTYLVLLALETARRILRHEYPRKNITVPFPTGTNETIKPGTERFPQLPTRSSHRSPTSRRRTSWTPARRRRSPARPSRRNSACQPHERRTVTARRRLGKPYGGVLALDDARFSARARRGPRARGRERRRQDDDDQILAGVIRPDEGEVRLGGDEVRLRSPEDALRRGVATVFQELTLLPRDDRGREPADGARATRQPWTDPPAGLMGRRRRAAEHDVTRSTRGARRGAPAGPTAARGDRPRSCASPRCSSSTSRRPPCPSLRSSGCSASSAGCATRGPACVHVASLERGHRPRGPDHDIPQRHRRRDPR